MIYVVLSNTDFGKRYHAGFGTCRFTAKADAELTKEKVVEKYPSAAVHMFKNMKEAEAYTASFSNPDIGAI